MTVAFFGHGNAPLSVDLKLKELLTELITKKEATVFYVGNQGSFDSMVLSILKELKNVFPYIEYYIVLAYMPVKKREADDNCTVRFFRLCLKMCILHMLFQNEIDGWLKMLIMLLLM